MTAGTQFTGTVAASQTQRWYVQGWPSEWHVVWTVVPTSSGSGGPQLEWDVEVERAADGSLTYWVSVHNLTTSDAAIEARYVIFNQ
jgi:hypothetical protein